MTVAAQTPINQYTGNGGTASYPFTFPVFLPTEFTATVVYNSITYVLVLGTDYSVSGLNAAGTPASTGTITIINNGQLWQTGGNLQNGATLTIQRTMAVAQTASIRDQGDFDRGFLEDALDKQAMISQDIALQQTQSVPAASTPYPTFTTDVTVTPAGSGLIVADGNGNGKTYRILVYNGQIATQEIT